MAILKLLFERSFGRFERQVNKTVFATAVNGVVLGVNVPVYKPVPFTILRLETYPVMKFSLGDVAINNG